MNDFNIKVNLSIELILKYFFVFFVILDCNSLYLSDYSVMKNIRYVLYFFMILCLCGIIYREKYLLYKKILQWIMSIIGVIFFFGMLFLLRPHSMGATFQLTLSLSIIVTYFVFCVNKEDVLEFLSIYKNIMIGVAVVSLFFWLLGSQLNLIEPTGYLYSTWAANDNDLKQCYSYYNIYFETQATDSFEQDSFVRNTAFFTEGPMSSFNFTLAFLVSFFLLDKISKTNILILLLAVLSTVSSTGYIIVLISFFIKYLMLKSKGYISIIMKYFFVPVIGILALIGCLYVLWDKSETTSLLLRVDDFIVGYYTWRENPILGYGVGNGLESLANHMEAWRMFRTGFSNSLFDVLSNGGVYLLSLYVIPLLYSIKLCSKNKQYNTVCFIMLFGIMCIFTIVSFRLIVFATLSNILVYAIKKDKLDEIYK